MKRVMDLLIVVVFSPIWVAAAIVIALMIRWRLGSPVFFSQERPGMEGRTFKLVKFRTMTDAYSEDGMQLGDAARMTSFGRFLRLTSLDELPELWNVLRGDMSLVGPRPLLPEYLPLYSPLQARRHEVRPGITGWAQVNGRNAIRWEERFELDTWYVDHQSFWLDLRILWLTVLTVFRREGISHPGHATMEKFRGSQQ